jgi:hypothetical protein
VPNWRTIFPNRSNVIPGFRRGIIWAKIFLILDIYGALDLIENVSVLGYADNIKLLMTIKCIGDFQLFQKDLDRLGEWCRGNKFVLNACQCNDPLSSFIRLMGRRGAALERVDDVIIE